MKIYRHILIFTLLLLTGFLASRIYFRLDLSIDSRYTLSTFTQSTLSSLDKELKITWYRSGAVPAISPVVREIGDVLSDFHEISGGLIRYSIQDPDTKEKIITISGLGIVPRQIPVETKDGQVLKDLFSGILIEYAGQHRSIPFIIETYNIEYELLRQILDLTSGSEYSRKIQIIYAGMPNDFYSYAEPWLAYAGFQTVVLEPGNFLLNNNVPLVVFGSSRISESDSAKITNFLEAGGNAAFFVSSNTVSVLTDWKATPKTDDFLLPALASRGFSIDTGLLADIFNFRITMPALDGSKYENINYPYWITTLPHYTGKEHILFSGISTLQFFWPSRILDGNHTILVTSSPSSVRITEPYDTNPMGKPMSVFSDGEKTGQGSLIAVSENKSRIIVISDEYMTSAMVEYSGSDTNLDFLVNCAEWLSNRDSLLVLKKGK